MRQLPDIWMPSLETWGGGVTIFTACSLLSIIMWLCVTGVQIGRWLWSRPRPLWALLGSQWWRWLVGIKRGSTNKKDAQKNACTTSDTARRRLVYTLPHTIIQLTYNWPTQIDIHTVEDYMDTSTGHSHWSPMPILSNFWIEDTSLFRTLWSGPTMSGLYYREVV